MLQAQPQAEPLRSVYADALVLVVGGGGFIGRAVTEALVSLRAEVVVLGRRPDTRPPNHPRCSQLVADVTDRQQVSAALAGRRFDYAFNLSGTINHARFGQGGRQVVDTHFGGLCNLLQTLDIAALRGFVQVGSSDEYGNAPAPQAEDYREAPISPYSAAKVAATHLVQALARTEGFPGAVVRYFLVYGPGQDKGRFVPQIIKGALADREFPTSAGTQLRDFCYLDDAVEGTLLAGAVPEARGEVFNIASGRPVAIREVIEAVVRLVGRGSPVFGAHPLRPGENMALYADASKAQRLLGFEATTSLEQGLSRTIAWFREREEEK
jgi:nucleoside-diphosphate-sugar epimerase